jgi:hypothetical protein
MEDLLNKQYNELAYYTLGLQDECFVHQYIVDAYTLQMANKSTKSISVTFSLVGLYLYVEKNFTGKEVQEFHTLMSKHKIIWPIFNLPENRGKISICMILESEIGEERNKMIKIWCNSIWTALKIHHSEIEKIAEYYLNIKRKTTNR